VVIFVLAAHDATYPRLLSAGMANWLFVSSSDARNIARAAIFSARPRADFG